MLKRTTTALAAAFVLALGSTGAALAANGADDPAGHHHGHGHQGHHHHHNGKADDHGRGDQPGDDHGGKGHQPGDDNGGQSESAQGTAPSGESGY